MVKYTPARRRGTSLIELLAALLITSFMMTVMLSVGGVKLASQTAVDVQYTIVVIDGYMSDIYHDFHNSISFSSTVSPLGIVSLTFVKEDGASIYEFDPVELACYKDGNIQFKCKRFEAIAGGNSLYVAVKLEDERLLEMNIFV